MMSSARVGSRLSESSRLPQIVEPGLKVQLSCELAYGYQNFHSSIVEVGAAHADVIVVWPRLPTREHAQLRSGQDVMIEVPVEHDALYGIETVVGQQQPEYLEFLALNVSGEWKRIQRRHYVRVPVNITPDSAERVHDGATSALQARVLDLSAGGIRLRLKEQVPTGQVLRVRFSFAGDPKPLVASIEVRRVIEAVDGKQKVWEAGCRFLDLKESDRDRVTRFIFAEQRRLAREAAAGRTMR